MSLVTAISPQDQQALDEATARGDLPLVTADWVSELTPVRAVQLGLARHVKRIQAPIENPLGPTTTIAFKTVTDEWSDGLRPANYPSAVILPAFTRELDAKIAVPVREKATGQDLISADDGYALWKLGEDVGEAVIHIFASNKPHRDALRSAVESALVGSIDRLQGLALPIPQIYLPPPFRQLPAAAPLLVAYVSFKGSMDIDDARGAETGIWRADITFRWQNQRFAARPRLPDLRTEIKATVTPEQP